MKFTRKLMLASGALLLPISAVVLIGAGSVLIGAGTASAAKSNSAGAGPLTCTKIKGTITFTPPLTNSGTAAETSTEVVISLSKCKGPAHQAGDAKKGKVHENIVAPGATDSCSSLLGTGPPTPENLTVNWSPASDGSSSSSYSGYSVVTNSAGDEGFGLPNSGGTGSTAGSYMEASGTTADAYSNQNASQLGAECAGAGIHVLKVTSGNTTL